MQQFQLIKATDKVNSSLTQINSNFSSLLSNSQGVAFPVEGHVEGQSCYRSDIKTFNVCSDKAANTWVKIFDVTTGRSPDSEKFSGLTPAQFLRSDLDQVLTGNLTVSKNLTVSGDITSTSDRRVKTNIKKLQGALDKINNINGYTFNRTDIETSRQAGVLAQEILKVLPEAVSTDSKGMHSVAYGNLIALVIESIKELSNQVKEISNGC